MRDAQCEDVIRDILRLSDVLTTKVHEATPLTGLALRRPRSILSVAAELCATRHSISCIVFRRRRSAGWRGLSLQGIDCIVGCILLAELPTHALSAAVS